MSVISALRPSNLPFAPNSASTSSHPNSGTVNNTEQKRPFQHETSYINLNRMLIRYQHLILLTPSPTSTSTNNQEPTALQDRPLDDDLTPLQRQIQSELWSPVPYHRTKWLRNIEGARNILLQLERTAQGIKVQRTKQNVQKDLAEKRMLVKKLRNRVEEIGREVDSMGDEVWQLPAPQIEGAESVWDILQKQRSSQSAAAAKAAEDEEELKERKPVKIMNGDRYADGIGRYEKPSEKDTLLGTTASNIRRRGVKGQTADASSEKATYATGISGVNANEKALLGASREQDDITASMVSMAAQLKQQARAFQFSLDQDKGLLNKALEGLDRNLSGMEVASKNMAFLKRMSEGEGWWGRIKLYAIIFGMWVFAILLVFVGPKLGF